MCVMHYVEAVCCGDASLWAAVDEVDTAVCSGADSGCGAVFVGDAMGFAWSRSHMIGCVLTRFMMAGRLIRQNTVVHEYLDLYICTV